MKLTCNKHMILFLWGGGWQDVKQIYCEDYGHTTRPFGAHSSSILQTAIYCKILGLLSKYWSRKDFRITIVVGNIYQHIGVVRLLPFLFLRSWRWGIEVGAFPRRTNNCASGGESSLHHKAFGILGRPSLCPDILGATADSFRLDTLSNFGFLDRSGGIRRNGNRVIWTARGCDDFDVICVVVDGIVVDGIVPLEESAAEGRVVRGMTEPIY